MKKVQKFAFMVGFALTLLCTAVFAQQNGTFTDPRDKKVYKWIKIGEQTWMAQNIDYAGANDDVGACYDKKAENCKKYGSLYFWEEAMEVCPEGWHLPSKEEWQVLSDFAGGNEIAWKKLKAKNGWKEKGNGTDSFGFAALPGGLGLLYHGFSSIGSSGFWWSATEINDPYYWYMSYDDEDAYYAYRDNYGKAGLRSVRCVHD